MHDLFRPPQWPCCIFFKLLDDICQRRLLRVAPTWWQYTSRVASTVFEKRDALKELFHHILEHHDEYDENSVRCADGFKVRLDDFEFCFLLHTFNGIFEYSDVLFAILQDKKLDVQFCLARVKEFCDTVEQERGRFREIYEASERTARTAGAPSAWRGPAQEPRAHYQQLQQLQSKILDNILCQTQTRCMGQLYTFACLAVTILCPLLLSNGHSQP